MQTKLALDLHTDLVSINTYMKAPQIAAGLVMLAEEKIAALLSQLAETRRDLGMNSTATILDLRREG